MNDINTRFKEVLDYLISIGQISGSKDFASQVGVSTSMVTEIIKGRCNIGFKVLVGIALFTGVSLSWLLTGKGSMIEPTENQEPDAATDALRQENQALKQKNRELEEKLNTINKVLKGTK